MGHGHNAPELPVFTDDRQPDPFAPQHGLQGRTDLVKDLGERIDSWDDRLALRKATLQAQFTAMEVALSKMKSQSSWLAGQIAAMPATYAG